MQNQGGDSNNPERKDRNISEPVQTAWSGISLVLNEWKTQGRPLSYTCPVHPVDPSSQMPEPQTTIAHDALVGFYGGDLPINVLNNNLTTGLEKLSAFSCITNWIERTRMETGDKVGHERIFEYILEAHQGNAGAAIRDTMLYFHALARDDTAHVRFKSSPQKHRERFILENIAPISPNYPLPAEYDEHDLNMNLRNRVGEYYHQYWLMYMGLFFPRSAVKSMLMLEQIFKHGSIKRKLDFAIVKELDEMRYNLEALPETESPEGRGLLPVIVTSD